MYMYIVSETLARLFLVDITRELPDWSRILLSVLLPGAALWCVCEVVVTEEVVEVADLFRPDVDQDRVENVDRDVHLRLALVRRQQAHRVGVDLPLDRLTPESPRKLLGIHVLRNVCYNSGLGKQPLPLLELCSVAIIRAEPENVPCELVYLA